VAHPRPIRYTPFLVLVLVLVAWLLIPAFVTRIGRSTLYELQAPGIAGTSAIRDVQEYWSLRSRSRQELMETGRDLARQLNLYELRIQQNETLQEELARLEGMLGLTPEVGYRYAVARVARRDMSAWWQRLIIRKGHLDGIPEGAAVVFEGGVVGRIAEVHAYTSVVELVSSPSFRMAANILGDERPVTYQGDINAPMRPPAGTVRDVPPDIHVPPGEALELVSSRLGGVFPPGLYIGEIRQLAPGSDGLFQRGQVYLHPRLQSLMEVAVLVPMTPDTPAEATP